MESFEIEGTTFVKDYRERPMKLWQKLLLFACFLAQLFFVLKLAGVI